jgi:hypothetical protein
MAGERESHCRRRGSPVALPRMRRRFTQRWITLCALGIGIVAPIGANAQAELNEALAFVESRMKVQQWQSARFEHHRWKPSNMSFGAQQWTWNEAKEEWSPSFRKVVIESYNVDARQLTTPVRAGKHSITFECRASKCIKVIGSSATTVADGTPKQETTEVEKAQNTWFFASAAEAKRVAQALNRALKLLGAKPRAF